MPVAVCVCTNPNQWLAVVLVKACKTISGAPYYMSQLVGLCLLGVFI